MITGNFLIALEIMWKGMVGIFVASGVLYLAVEAMRRIVGPSCEK